MGEEYFEMKSEAWDNTLEKIKKLKQPENLN